VGILAGLLPRPYVSLSVYLFEKCTVAKRLTGILVPFGVVSGVGRGMGILGGGDDRRREGHFWG